MTRFLVDANLPPDLCHWIALRGFSAAPARSLGVRGVTDDAIWAWAVENTTAILTKDEDFPARRARSVAGPQIVWLRLGNSKKAELYEWLEPIWPGIVAELARGSPVIEVR
jgi:predicted nuclease of predicted toxin-antitoxin system